MNATVITSPERVVPRHGLRFTTWSPRTAALVAGTGLAVMAVLGGFANFGAVADSAAKAALPGASKLGAALGKAFF